MDAIAVVVEQCLIDPRAFPPPTLRQSCEHVHPESRE